MLINRLLLDRWYQKEQQLALDSSCQFEPSSQPQQ